MRIPLQWLRDYVSDGGGLLAGVVFALFMVYVPTIIDSIMTAVI